MIKCPKGIVEDLLIQEDKFKMPMDFIILEIKGDPLRQNEHMVLLGRPSIETTKTVIDIQSRKLTMTVLGETVQLQASIQCHILLLLLIINALLWIVIICLCLAFLFRAKMEMT